MWIVSQNRKHVINVTNVWLNSEKEGKCSIGAGYGSTADEELWNDIGKYKVDRANEIFEEIISCLGSVSKYEMPRE